MLSRCAQRLCGAMAPTGAPTRYASQVMRPAAVASRLHDAVAGPQPGGVAAVPSARCISLAAHRWRGSRGGSSPPGDGSGSKGDGTAAGGARERRRRRRRRSRRLPGGGGRMDEAVLAVDRSGLYTPHGYTRPKVGASTPSTAADGTEAVAKSDVTPLVQDLHALIAMRGPVSVADFMRQAMSHPTHGYYMRKDVFGTKGDFTTSPEISQMFGELLGVWVVATWEQLGSPAKFQLLEMGPGRGTLMADMLRVLRRFPQAYNAITVRMVEISPALRAIQQRTIGAVYESGSVPDYAGSPPKEGEGLKLADGPSISWHSSLSDIDADTTAGPIVAVAQELFDALPVHQFQKTDRGWRERLVDVVPDDDVTSQDHFRMVIAPGLTPALSAVLATYDRGIAAGSGGPYAKATAQALAYEVASLADEMKAASTAEGEGGDSTGDAEAAASDAEESDYDLEFNDSDMDSDDGSEPAATDAATRALAAAPLGATLEFSPSSSALAYELALRLDTVGGAALFIDYGVEHGFKDSLRGIRDHKFVSPLSSPGLVDLSVDVDFGALARAVDTSERTTAYGPVTQSVLLQSLGIEARLGQLLNNAATDEVKERLVGEVRRLIHPEEMGSVYKVLSISAPVPGEDSEGSTSTDGGQLLPIGGFQCSYEDGLRLGLSTEVEELDSDSDFDSDTDSDSGFAHDGHGDPGATVGNF